MEIQEFKKIILTFYKKNRRNFKWRETTNPYYIVVSEIMLQQTQVSRVEKKYEEFLKAFPNWKRLATATLSDVLIVWQGMGYNRRGRFLKQTAEKVHFEYKDILPSDESILVTFPGIGKATAASICAFAFNSPTVFIETNIRRVFIHHFFESAGEVHDREILPLVEKTLDRQNPREWYYALMDYGTYLAKILENPNKKSRHYVVQSKFEGSKRQVRSALTKLLLKQPSSLDELTQNIKSEKYNVSEILDELIKEGLVKKKKNVYSIG